jgi:exosortase J
MTAIPDSGVVLPVDFSKVLSAERYATLSVVLSVLGASTIWFTMFSLWTLWTNDALKSIGMIIPAVSLVLILRVWKRLSWEADGTWWGLVLLVGTVAVAHFQEQSILILVVSPRWSTVLPPPSLVLLAYGSGAVLLFGGTRLYRAALFPILLLYFANPIPHVFSSMIDMPLQHASAHVARAFAMSLGHTLTPDHLRLMFTPDFGMFIAPGCNGIRGSITMGFIALIAGYVYRFRWYWNGLVVLGAILLGYLFNLARLCVLVLYYAVALHFPWLQDKAENADYAIGAVLFLIATVLLFAAIARLGEGRRGDICGKKVDGKGDATETHPRERRYAELGFMGVIALLGCAGLGQARAMIHASTTTAARGAISEFPDHLGNYTLTRTWDEADVTGPVIYVWGEYTPRGGGTPIAIGVSPIPDWHDPVLCHTVRGQDPLWQGELTVAVADAVQVGLSSAFYNDGVTRHLEASTMCREGSCGEFRTDRTHFGFVYTRPDPKSVLDQHSEIPVRVLLRLETIDMMASAETERHQLTQDLEKFLADVRLGDLARPYGH